MDSIFKRSASAIAAVRHNYERELLRQIDWNDPLILILGPRGVGKTTLLLQRMKALDLPSSKALYVDVGDLYFRANRLIDFAEAFLERGGTHLFIDEIHRYGFSTWAPEVKQLYDLYRDRLNLVITGSSVIKILREQADLSRRALKYRMAGLSFREYLLLKHDIKLPKTTVAELATKGGELANDLLGSATWAPVEYLHEYWKTGYYPYFLESKSGYVNRLLDSVQTVLEHDIPYGTEAATSDPAKLGRLLYAIASSVPFVPNIVKLAERTGISRPTLLNYLSQLERAHLIATLRKESKGISALGKPDKIYLDNTNLVYALASNQAEIGSMRETFFLNQMSQTIYGQSIAPPEIRLPKRGDFAYIDRDRRYLFEIGGAKKSRKQIQGEENAFTVVDTERSGGEGRIPLWQFGLLY